jgi:hypothetical protein
MREKIKYFLTGVRDEVTYGIRCSLGRATPVKHFAILLIIGGTLSIAYIYTLVSSIYDIGKRDAEREFMELQHIESLKLQREQDSINILNQTEYEYEWSDR